MANVLVSSKKDVIPSNSDSILLLTVAHTLQKKKKKKSTTLVECDALVYITLVGCDSLCVRIYINIFIFIYLLLLFFNIFKKLLLRKSMKVNSHKFCHSLT